MNFIDEIKEQYTIQDKDYAEYLRLEKRKRTLSAELKSIQHQQNYLASKIKIIWDRDGIKNKKFGNITFFTKNNLIVTPNIAVEDKEIAQALVDADIDCVHTCVDWSALRDLIRRTEGVIPIELTGLLSVWLKKDLYIRIPKEKNNG